MVNSSYVWKKLYICKDRYGCHISNHKPLFDKDSELFTARRAESDFIDVSRRFVKGLKINTVKEISAFIFKGK